MHDKRLTADPPRSRTLSVNGITFNWVMPDSGHLVVQHGSGHGCAVVVELRGELKFEQVPDVVKLALDADWLGLELAAPLFLFHRLPPFHTSFYINHRMPSGIYGQLDSPQSVEEPKLFGVM